jgi:hypothetical protein
MKPTLKSGQKLRAETADGQTKTWNQWVAAEYEIRLQMHWNKKNGIGKH